MCTGINTEKQMTWKLNERRTFLHISRAFTHASRAFRSRKLACKQSVLVPEQRPLARSESLGEGVIKFISACPHHLDTWNLPIHQSTLTCKWRNDWKIDGWHYLTFSLVIKISKMQFRSSLHAIRVYIWYELTSAILRLKSLVRIGCQQPTAFRVSAVN